MINFFGALRIWAGLERTAESNLRLGVILSFVAGSTNAGGFLAVGLYTSHMTGLITDLGIELGKLVYINDRSMPTKVLANRPKLRSLLLLIGGFSVGGLVGALAFKHLGYTMTLPLAVLVLLPTAGPLLVDWRRRV